VIRALRSYRLEQRRSPTTTAWKHARLSPSAEAIIRHCGSWAAALALAGIPPIQRQLPGPDRREIAQALRAYQRQHGVAPTVTAWQRDQLTPSVKVIYRRFGSWPAALTHAGLATRTRPHHPARTR
jgi:hypothetical protein